MTTPLRLLAIQNDPTCPTGLFGPVLTGEGLSVETARAFAGEPVPADTSDLAGLLVLGGEMGATDDAECPWLPEVKALIRAAVAAGTPFLGICLGHQLAAEALGGRVQRNPQGRAVGLGPVSRNAEGRADPLLGGVPDGARAVAWNSDIVTSLPPGAVLLGNCADGSPQSVRFGKVAWGVQFHPELTPEIFRSWLETDDPKAEAAAVAVDAVGRELVSTWSPLAGRFAGICRDHSSIATIR